MQQSLIIRPLVTEKTMADVNKGKYSFVVAVSATKSQIKYALKQMFHVTVVSVATSIVKGKSKRVGERRVEVADSLYKKAVVKLKKGDKISLFEPGEEEKKK